MEAGWEMKAASCIMEADAILISAGAGMGVDSGLPDFRGDEGFWEAYPPYRKLGKSFVEMANPAAFATDPEFAWGFYGHRLNLYRNTEPHEGFRILRRWAKGKAGGAFVMTSNVDGHFQKAGFSEDSIYEVHGSIHYLQSSTPSPESGIWPANGVEIKVDETTMRAVSPLPRCPVSKAMARPNILMFGDWGYDGTRNDKQLVGLERWLSGQEDSSIAIVEMGAGRAVPTVRHFSEDVVRRNRRATLLRINPREPEIPFSAPHLSIRMGARDALERIDNVL